MTTDEYIDTELLAAHLELFFPPPDTATACFFASPSKELLAQIDAADDHFLDGCTVLYYPLEYSALDPPYNGALEVGRTLIRYWNTMDITLQELHDQISVHGPLEPSIHIPNSNQNIYISGLKNSEGKVDYDTMSENSRANAVKYDPDFVLADVVNAPADYSKTAFTNWLKYVMKNTSLASTSLDASVELNIFWVEIGADLGMIREQMANGKVRLTYSASGKLGAVLRGKAVEASVGGEVGVFVTHEFDDNEKADDFTERVIDALFDDLDLTDVGELLWDGHDGSITNAVLYGGVYAEAEAELDIPANLGELESEFSGGLYYGYDHHTKERIIAFKGSAEVELEFDGKGSVEGGVNVDFEGEWRQGSNGSEVEISFRIDGVAGTESEKLKELFPGLDSLTGGAGLTIKATLGLDDNSSKEAWKNLLNPVDGSLNVAEFLQRATVTAQVEAVQNSDLLDFDADIGVLSSEIKVEQQSRLTVSTYIKSPRDSEFQRLSFGDD